MAQHDSAASAAAQTERTEACEARKPWQPPCIQDVSVAMATAAEKMSSSTEFGSGKDGS